MLSTLAAALVLSVSSGATPAAPATPVSFEEFFDPSPRELLPSAKLRSLEGQRVRLVGYMARLEQPMVGGFFLASRPVVCDEAGEGTADLPPSAVFVVMRAYDGKEVPFSPRLLEVTGRLEIGARNEPDGRVTRLRLVLDRRDPPPVPRSPPGSKSREPSSSSTPSKEKA
jgi:hypothetical protein